MAGSRIIGAALMGVLVMQTAPRAGAEPKRPSEKDRQAAGELVKKAIAKSQAGDHEGAITTYKQAYAIVPNPALLSNIGAEYQQSGKPAEALDYFCQYLAAEPDGANAPYATTQARLMHKQLGHKRSDDALCAPEEATRPAPPEREPVTERTLETVPVATTARGNTTLVYGGLIAGAVGLIATGIGFYEGYRANQISDEISSHNVGMSWGAIRDREATGQRHENLQIGFHIAGGALVAGGVVMYLLGRSSGEERSTTTARVHVTPTTNGFAVSGRF